MNLRANVFTIGGEIGFQTRFIEKLNLRGFQFDWVGGKDWNVCSRMINIPKETDFVLCLKDLCPHPQRDPVRDKCKELGLQFIEVEHTISKSYDPLIMLVPQYHIPPEYESTIEEGLDGLFVVDFDAIAYSIFPYKKEKMGSKKKMATYWLQRQKESNSPIPFQYSRYISKKFNPLLDQSEMMKKFLKEGKMRDRIIHFVKAWVLGAEEQNVVFKSRQELSRYLGMTFGIKVEDLDGFESEILEKKEEINYKNYEPKPKPLIEEEEIIMEEEEIIMEEEITIEENNAPIKKLILKGIDLNVETIKIKEINAEDLEVKGYEVSIEEIRDGVLYGVEIK